MKRLRFTRIVLFFTLFLLSQKARSQFVHIPNSAFANYLYNYEVTDPNCWDNTYTYLDSTCADVLSTQTIIMCNEGITDITGVDVFKNLQELYVFENALTQLPKLPPNLKILDAHSNIISTVTNFPDSLKRIELEYNQIQQIPALPSQLEVLNINVNNISTIPNYPTSLKTLYFRWNPINFCPNFWTGLEELDISGSQITSINSLPSTLVSLSCSNLNLQVLPPIPPTLKFLTCDNSFLSNIPPLPSSLIALNCNNNPIHSLPSLPSSLEILYCSNDSLTVLPQLPSSLNSINGSFNQISHIDSFPNSLNNINFSHNLLTEVPELPNFYVNLLDFSYNQISVFPIAHWTYTSISPNVNFSNNNLTSIPRFANKYSILNLSNNPNLFCLPYLKQVGTLDFSNTSISCLPNYGTVTNSTPALSSVPLCDVFNSNGCQAYWNISGSTHLETNSNCQNDLGDIGLLQLKHLLFKNGSLIQQAYSGGEGFFSFDTDTSGIYKTQIDTNNIPFNVICPSNKYYLDTIIGQDSMKYNKDFYLKCKDGYNVSVFSIMASHFKPGTNNLVEIFAGDLSANFQGNCSKPTAGQLKIIFNGPISVLSAGPYGINLPTFSGDTLVYFVSDFSAINPKIPIKLYLLTDTTASIGDYVCIQCSVDIDSVEYNYSDNIINICRMVVSSFDPNDKQASPSDIVDIGGEKWIKYLIRFQNTGTASADNIFVLDTISQDLDISSFTLTAYSHQPLIQIFNNRVAKFSFPNINLPDSTSNEPESHGFIEYKIKANDTIPINNTITNTAYIYFDFNSPVITNTTQNTAINCQISPTLIQDTICMGTAYILNGVSYKQDGIYLQHLITKYGCDSIVELHLTTNKATITRNLSTLITDQNNGQYQWIFCSTGSIIPGATGQSYQPTQSGNYAVIVNFAGCSDTSDCYYYSPLSLNEILSSQIKVAPNPFKNELKINLGTIHADYLEVYSLIGELIDTQKIQSEEIVLNTKEWPQGMYLLRMISPSESSLKKW